MKEYMLDDKKLDELTLEEVDQYVMEHNSANDIQKKKENLDITFSIVNNFGSLSENRNAPIFSLVDWNGYLRYDIRRWRNQNTLPGKGITLDSEEIKILALINISDIELLDNVREEYFGGKVKAEIYNNVCILSQKEQKGVMWKKEINVIDWGYGKKIDIRKWSESYDKCSKGISLTNEEFNNLVNNAKKICNN